jgi:hypothetical protein
LNHKKETIQLSGVVNIEENNLKQGVMGLVVALVEIIREALQLQAIRRMESGSLNQAEIERLGEALMDLEEAIETVKVDIGITDSVRTVREGLDKVVEELVDKILDPFE